MSDILDPYTSRVVPEEMLHESARHKRVAAKQANRGRVERENAQNLLSAAKKAAASKTIIHPRPAREQVCATLADAASRATTSKTLKREIFPPEFMAACKLAERYKAAKESNDQPPHPRKICEAASALIEHLPRHVAASKFGFTHTEKGPTWIGQMIRLGNISESAWLLIDEIAAKKKMPLLVALARLSHQPQDEQIQTVQEWLRSA